MHRAWLQSDHVRLVIESPEPSIPALVRSLLPEYAHVPARDVSTAARVAVERIGHRFRVDAGGDPLTCGEPDLAATLEFALARALLAADPVTARLHGAGVSLPAGAALFVGPSGSGKSTLALHLVLDGWPLLSDDHLIVRADGRVTGLRRHLKVDSPTSSAVGLDPPDTCLWREGASEVWIDPTPWGGWAREPVRARWLFFPEPRGGGTSRLEALTPGEAYQRLLDARAGGGSASLEPLAELLEQAEPFLLQAPDVRSAVAAVRSCVGTPTPR